MDRRGYTYGQPRLKIAKSRFTVTTNHENANQRENNNLENAFNIPPSMTLHAPVVTLV